jgi:hypothetical protein
MDEPKPVAAPPPASFWKDRLWLLITCGVALVVILGLVGLSRYLDYRREREYQEKRDHMNALHEGMMAGNRALTEQWRRETQLEMARTNKWPKSRIETIQQAHSSGGAAAAQFFIDQWTTTTQPATGR